MSSNSKFDNLCSMLTLLIIYLISKAQIIMSISKFADTIDHPLSKYFANIPYHKANQQKSKLWFLSGDPTVYGAQQFRMPQKGYEIVRKTINQMDVHGYCDSKGTENARKAVLKIMKSSIPLSPQNVLINHGVNMGLLGVAMAFCNPGDQILVPEIGYPFFTDLCPSIQCKAIPYKLKANKNFQIDLDHMKTLVTDKTQFIFVINPSNPMGTTFSKKHMEEIIQFADQHQLPIVSDQVYYGQVFPGNQFYSFAQVTSDVPVVILSGMEKMFSTPGWSVSWTVIVDKHGYIDAITNNLKVISTIFLHPNKFVQQSLNEIIENVGLFVNQQMTPLQKMHDYLYDRLSKIRGLQPIKAQGTIYLSVKIDVSEFKDIKSDEEFINKALQEQNINAVPLTVFGGQINGFRLITCGKRQFYDEFIERLQQFLKNHYKD